MDWKVHRLIKIHTECEHTGLFFNSIPCRTFLPSVLQCLDPIGKKKSSTAAMISAYELFSPPFYLIMTEDSCVEQQEDNILISEMRNYIILKSLTIVINFVSYIHVSATVLYSILQIFQGMERRMRTVYPHWIEWKVQIKIP